MSVLWSKYSRFFANQYAKDFTFRDFNDEFDQLPLVILAKNKKSQKPIVHDTQLHLL